MLAFQPKIRYSILTNSLALHRGNGFCTDAKVLAKVHSASNAAVFFKSIMSKPYLNQIVLAPHLYCPMVWRWLFFPAFTLILKAAQGWQSHSSLT